ncbi:serine/threonine-protein kinase [Pleurocapsa sp. PCC 7319]|uniref:serine/threonine protein kinase n=1 Tax=Pleurocapsa sp. PCC 7319 TaxID=118161 RepID=UPI00034B6304|nr:serine/threonine-protein kinase [Pleurocapsa sp. PCC 7319]
MDTLHQPQEVIANRYQIITTLGQGGMGTTYAAIDLTNSQEVAIKVVSLHQTNDWKVLELFQREATVLASLNHPYIPNYLDYFQLDTENDRKFYLVQELIEGKSLADLVTQGWHSTEQEVQDIARQLLEILVYLHSLNPSVIHRDIKPQNIIRRDDGKVYLVDFGAVQAVYRHTIGIGGTFVGTLGYMSPEQLRGKVIPASDLYSLGCSLLFLLTHRSPHELPQKGMGIDFSSRVNISPSFAQWLTRIIEPIAEDRFQSAENALIALPNYQVFVSGNILNQTLEASQTNGFYALKKNTPKTVKNNLALEKINRPKFSRIHIINKDHEILITIPVKIKSITISLLWAIATGIKKIFSQALIRTDFIGLQKFRGVHRLLMTMTINLIIVIINTIMLTTIAMAKPVFLILLLIPFIVSIFTFAASIQTKISPILLQYGLNMNLAIYVLLLVLAIDILWLILNYIFGNHIVRVKNNKMHFVHKFSFFTISQEKTNLPYSKNHSDRLSTLKHFLTGFIVNDLNTRELNWISQEIADFLESSQN